jgi:hypothetical protein
MAKEFSTFAGGDFINDSIAADTASPASSARSTCAATPIHRVAMLLI